MALVTAAPTTPAKEAPLEAEEIMRRIAETEQLEGVGRSFHFIFTNLTVGPDGCGGWAI